ncbi:MAG: flagellar hook-length control protein FliK [Candidatus Eisenbacteria bacterium]|uniref:Flagellar hook-length control protein FliK n=1 Tax=Eiseniibacteriota bacterium TaxID=2212470 RepID=A0A956NI21_UNCEI|nr:flagellar hook-length control protein FliK [Candidatus Eisenbacteria bacterium]MCB9463962.1 flagellar hook-length control protein FliK [Candidatus Eisenbacteria bacterium]
MTRIDSSQPHSGSSSPRGKEASTKKPKTPFSQLLETTSQTFVRNTDSAPTQSGFAVGSSQGDPTEPQATERGFAAAPGDEYETPRTTDDARAAEESGAAAAADQAAPRNDSRRHTTESAAKNPKTQLETLLPKLVEAFRIGRNRAGSAEVQMDLKATTAGGMGIRMRQGPRGIQALLTVDQYATKQALEAQVGELTRRLEAQGLRVDEIRVSIGSDEPRPSGGNPQGDQGSHDPYADSPGAGPESHSWSSGSEVTGAIPSTRPSGAAGAGSPSRRSRTDYSL